MFLSRKATLCVICFMSLFVMPIGTTSKVPDEAYNVALTKLKSLAERLVNGPNPSVYGGQVTLAEIQRATLGECFLRKWGIKDEAIANVSPQEMLQADCTILYCFPVFVDDRFIGTVNVKEDPDHPGRFIPGTRWRRSDEIERVVDFQKKYPAADGYSVYLFEPFNKHFMVIEQNHKAVLITPVDNMAADYLEMRRKNDPNYPLIDVNDGLYRIQRVARNRLRPVEE